MVIVDVIGMFPDIDRQQGRLAVGDRGIGIVAIDDVDATLGGLDQPGPARTEVGRRLGVECILERIEGAELGVDGLGQFSRRLATAVGRQAVPVEGVIPYLRPPG